jgi:RimJ/RimL family protein N-acetyltransferase
MPSPEPILRDIPEQFESDRLTIRAPRPGDGARVFEAVAESLVDLRQYPASMRWAVSEQSMDSCEKFCREGYSNFLARRDLPLLLILRGTDVVVGSSGLHRFDWSIPKFEVGFWGRTTLHGKGLITEGVGAIVDLAFSTLGARRVEALPDDENTRSWRVCERLGFTLEGVLRNERVDPDGTLRNTRIYAKIK